MTVVDGGEGGGAFGGVVADSLDVEQTSVGLKADLPQGWQVRQPFPEAEIGGFVDGGLRTDDADIESSCEPPIPPSARVGRPGL